MLALGRIGVRDGHWSSIGMPTMQAESEKRAAQEDEEQRACPVKRRAVGVVGRGPEPPEELQIS